MIANAPSFRSFVVRAWSQSRWYRVALIAAGIYFVLRLLLHFAFIGEFFPDDFRIYLDAAHAFSAHQPLYPPLPLEQMEMYQYSPFVAMLSVSLTWLPRVAAAVIFSILHVMVYAALYWRWDQIFARGGFERGRTILASLLPLWLIWTAFWSAIAFLNIYMFMALLGTLLIEAVMQEKLALAVLWLTIILQIEPQWGFAAVVPLLLGRYRFAGMMIGASLLIYALIGGATVLIAGPYAQQQYSLYYQLLSEMTKTFPFYTMSRGFIGYNHSLMQTVFFFTGITPTARLIVTVIKVLILLPLGIVAVRHLLNPARKPGSEVPFLSLDLALALYCAAFIWLDVVWELSLGIAVFTYLLATVENRTVRTALWIVLLPYALADMIQFVSYIVLGDAALIDESYVVTDPSIYVPLILIMALLFYGVLVWRLWQRPVEAESPVLAQSGPAS